VLETRVKRENRDKLSGEMNVGMKESELDMNVTILIVKYSSFDSRLEKRALVYSHRHRCVVSNNTVFTPHMNVNPPLAVPVCHD